MGRSERRQAGTPPGEHYRVGPNQPGHGQQHGLHPHKAAPKRSHEQQGLEGRGRRTEFVGHAGARAEEPGKLAACQDTHSFSSGRENSVQSPQRRPAMPAYDGIFTRQGPSGCREYGTCLGCKRKGCQTFSKQGFCNVSYCKLLKKSEPLQNCRTKQYVNILKTDGISNGVRPRLAGAGSRRKSTAIQSINKGLIKQTVVHAHMRATENVY